MKKLFGFNNTSKEEELDRACDERGWIVEERAGR